MTFLVQFHIDDLIPRLADAGFMEELEEFAAENKNLEEVTAWATTKTQSPSIDQVYELIRDWKASGKDTKIEVDGVDLSGGTARPVAPSSPGIGNGNVWVTPPEGSYTLRFYVEGVLKLEADNVNMPSLALLGATSGDIIQICQVADGVVGWWARISVP